jgi:hypothetical protein
MLDFIITEWGNLDSIFFKGYNINKDIYDNDTKEIKKEKLEHNTVYLLYNIIIQIANLFRNQTFFLPVYADF